MKYVVAHRWDANFNAEIFLSSDPYMDRQEAIRDYEQLNAISY